MKDGGQARERRGVERRARRRRLCFARRELLFPSLQSASPAFRGHRQRKYDKGYVEVDGTVCIKANDLPLVCSD
ncbi:MAG: hypothetical protein WDN31_10490 [Hyphomicrobium sp.]